MNCLAVHLSANSWLNLNILTEMNASKAKAPQGNKVFFVQHFQMHQIPLTLALTYPLGLYLVLF